MPTRPRAIHPFPARMASSIPWAELQSDRPLRVLDPMVGSGTTPAVASGLGHTTVAFDLDPLAVLISTVWSSTGDPKVLGVGQRIQERAARTWRAIPLRCAYPKDATPQTKAFIRYWFDGPNRKQLAALSNEIFRIKNETQKRILWVAFSRLIITKQAGASMAMDLAHSRPHRVKKPPMRPLEFFARELGRVLSSLPKKAGEGSTTISVGDARSMPIESNSIDIIVTSPPYLNAIDYLRTSKFTLVWLGHSVEDLRLKRSTIIGTEKTNGVDIERTATVALTMGAGALSSSRHRRIVAKYIQDMDLVMSECSRVLAPGGKMILVVGDNIVAGSRIRNSAAIQSLAEQHGLTSLRHSRRALPASRRYLPPPAKLGSPELNDRMRSELLLRFVKPGAQTEF